MVVWSSSSLDLCVLASAVIPLEGIKAPLRFRVLGLFSFRQGWGYFYTTVTRTPQKQLLLKLHRNRFLADDSDRLKISDTTFKSSAKSGLSSAHSNNNN